MHLEAKQEAQKSSLSCIDCVSVNYSMCSIGFTVVWWLLVLCLQSFLLWTVMVALCGCLLLQFLPFCIPVMLFLLAGAFALCLVVALSLLVLLLHIVVTFVCHFLVVTLPPKSLNNSTFSSSTVF